jgi:hypothetical protein
MPRARKTQVDIDDAEFARAVGEMTPDPAPASAPRKRAPRAAAGSPRPRSRAAGGAAAGRPPTKAQLRATAREEIGMWLTLFHAGWELRDPTCAQSLTADAVDTVADRVTAMVARSDGLLRIMGRAGVLSDAMMVITALREAVATVWHHHGPGGVGHGTDRSGEDVAAYPAYRPA